MKMAREFLLLGFLAATLTLFLSLNAVSGLELDSFMLDALDDTTFALEKERSIKDKVTKTITDSIMPMVARGHKVTKLGVLGGRKRLWSSSRRRRRSYAKRVKRPIKPKSRKRAPLNKHLQATNQVRKGLLEAGAMRQGLSKTLLQQQIKEACNSKEYVFARQMLGHTIFSGLKGSRRGRKRRAATSASSILTKIKDQIGKAQYDKLMAFDGGVTLAFAMDTTGSMYDEIGQAKHLASGIINQERTYDVDYILSPFNDPITDSGHGPVTYMEPQQRANFVQLIGNLKARGGGDCDELAINGIMSIFEASIQYQSPIYVFTDAGAKDATDENKEALKEMIDAYAAPVNFFLSNAGCMNTRAIDLYKELAEFSGGQILYFSRSRSSRLSTMTDYVKNALIGGANIPAIQIARKRRSIGNVEYSIQVDNSMDTLSATVMTSSVSSNIQLYNPGGSIQSAGKTSTGQGSLFLINKPTPGVWKLSVPVTSTDHFVTVRGISEENIDFEYVFLVEAKVRRKPKSITSNSPVKGRTATLIITVPAHKKTQPSSLQMQVVNSAFKPSLTVNLRQHGRSPGRYIGAFPTPSHDFKLILNGKTKENKPFKRLANGIVKPKSAVIHVFAAPRGFVLRRTGSSTILLFALHNFGASEHFHVRSKELKNYIYRQPKRIISIAGRMALFSVALKAPSSAKKGQTHDVVMSVVGKTSGTRASMHVQMLIL